MKSILPYTEEHGMFRVGLAKFIEKEIAPYYEQWEKDRIIPRALYRKMGELGYYNPTGDPEYGGDGGDFLYWQIIYTRERQVFGKPLASFQNTQFVLAELVTQIEAGRALVEKCILLELAGENVDVAAAMAKNYCCEMQNRVMYQCQQLFGGYGYCTEYEISRRFVDARIQNIYGGTTQVMQMITAKALYSGKL